MDKGQEDQARGTWEWETLERGWCLTKTDLFLTEVRYWGTSPRSPGEQKGRRTWNFDLWSIAPCAAPLPCTRSSWFTHISDSPGASPGTKCGATGMCLAGKGCLPFLTGRGDWHYTGPARMPSARVSTWTAGPVPAFLAVVYMASTLHNPRTSGPLDRRGALHGCQGGDFAHT